MVLESGGGFVGYVLLRTCAGAGAGAGYGPGSCGVHVVAMDMVMLNRSGRERVIPTDMCTWFSVI